MLSLGTGLAAPVLPIFARSFNVSFGVASLVIIARMVGATASTIPTGYLVDRIGRRRILLIGPIIAALASFLTASAQSFPQLLVYRFLAGWGQQMWMISRLTVVADTTTTGERGRQIASMVGVSHAGALMGPALGGFSAAIAGIRAPFLIHGVLAAIAIIPSFGLIRETSPVLAAANRDTPGQSAPKSSYSYAALLTGPVLLLFVAQLLANLIRGASGQGGGGPLFLYAAYAYDAGPALLGTLGTIGAVLGLPLIFLAGSLMDKFGRKAAVVPGTLLLAAGLFFLAVSAYFKWPIESFMAGFLWTNTTVSLMSGSMQTMGSDVAPPQARGKFFGLQRLVGEAGMLLSPISFAVLAELVNYTVAFAFLGFVGIATVLWISIMIKDTRIPA